jgi:uncharacterized protein
MARSDTALRDDAIDVQQPGLRGTYCRECRRRSFLHRSVCPHCGAEAVDNLRLDSLGTVVSWTVVHQAPEPIQTPYTLVTVDLHDGVRLLGGVVGSVEIGDLVAAELVMMRTDDDGNALWWYRFRKADQ